MSDAMSDAISQLTDDQIREQISGLEEAIRSSHNAELVSLMSKQRSLLIAELATRPRKSN